MQALSLSSPVAAGLLLAPSLVFAALALMGDAPGEWGRGALIAWTALAAALLAGATLAASAATGAGFAAWVALGLGFGAVMIGGPPGLFVAAVAAAALVAAGADLPVARWLAFGLALPPALIALRQAVG